MTSAHARAGLDCKIALLSVMAITRTTLCAMRLVRWARIRTIPLSATGRGSYDGDLVYCAVCSSSFHFRRSRSLPRVRPIMIINMITVSTIVRGTNKVCILGNSFATRRRRLDLIRRKNFHVITRNRTNNNGLIPVPAKNTTTRNRDLTMFFFVRKRNRTILPLRGLVNVTNKARGNRNRELIPRRTRTTPANNRNINDFFIANNSRRPLLTRRIGKITLGDDEEGFFGILRTHRLDK